MLNKKKTLNDRLIEKPSLQGKEKSLQKSKSLVVKSSEGKDKVIYKYKAINEDKVEMSWDQNDTRALNYTENKENPVEKMFNLDPKTWCMTGD